LTRLAIQRKLNRSVRLINEKDCNSFHNSCDRVCCRLGEELGINPNMLARWRREQIGEMDKASSPEESLKPSEMAEMLAEARREIEDLREQRDILKKTLSIFSQAWQSGRLS
jgi:transposase